ncbi:Putative carboxylesterase 11 [Glycine soja]|uniref:Putative carboxylesterase 11 n=1 Tax=Glycine soja TaxID=3848 RepID=A0A0B2R6N7_GLYSO|nr:Putative carboxylesterase 11 [Glycine soja]
MPSVAVKLYSVFFKFLLKHRLQNRIQAPPAEDSDSFGVTTRPDESVAPANPSFSDGVATKDIHIDPLTSLSIRIFLPDSALEPNSKPSSKPEPGSANPKTASLSRLRRNSYEPAIFLPREEERRNSVGDVGAPAAFEDGMKVLNWLAKQANLAECSKLMGGRRLEGQHKHIVGSFGASMVEPWLAAHGNPSRSSCTLGWENLRILTIKEKGMVDTRCVLLGVSCGANIADHVARKAVEAGKLLDPVKVVAQVLMYPFFIGSVPTRSEIKLANSYFYDKAMCMLAWKLFLPEKEFSLDHPAANPLAPDHSPPLKKMPPTLTVVADHDWMRDRAIAYSEELRKVNVDAPVYEYKDAVHEFATLDVLLKSPQAQVCAEDIAIWVKKYISLRGHEFSY